MLMTVRTRLLLVAVMSLGVTLTGTAAQAQYRASLQGTVTDAQGGIIPGATVTLVDKDTSRTLTAVTNENGVYIFNALAPRPYTIEVELAGLQESRASGCADPG
jgi:protocatechuate 3,4-dioxygenase beta subunit